MRSQLDFFMSEADQRDFVAAFADEADAVDCESASRWSFRVGSAGVEFSPSPRSKDQLALGRIAIATHFGDKLVPESEGAERLFKRMRSWLRKRYSNRLVAQNIMNPSSTTSYRTMWLGPNAQEHLRTGTITLWTILGARVIVREEPNKAPEPTTTSVTPRATERESR